ncbi:MAG: PD-(D/E)XK nuclease family protein [Nitrososphaeraceae archaeon]
MFRHLETTAPINIKSVDGVNGRYYHTPNGKYPSITTVLGAKDKSWVTNWRDSLGHKKADAETKRATDRGTAVHLMLEKYILNQPNVTSDQLHTHIAEFNSLRLYINKINNVMLQEAALYSDILKVAGRVDCIAEYNNQLSVIDFKTATRDRNANMIEDYYKQATFYALAFEELYNIQINNIVIIMSVEKGFPLIFQEKVENWIAPLLVSIDRYYKNL